MEKKLVIVENEDTMYYLEDEDGFRVSSKEEIDDLLRRKIIKFKYPKDQIFYYSDNEKKASRVKVMI